MAELMFQCSLFLVFLISSLFGKSYWLCISRRDLILHMVPNEKWSSMWVLRICLDMSSTSSLLWCSSVKRYSWGFPFLETFILFLFYFIVIGKKACNIIYPFFFFFKKTKIKNDRKWAVSVRIKQDTQNKWSLGCLSKLPPPDQIFIYFLNKLFLCW